MKDIQSITTGASGSSLYDLYGKYILKTTTAESQAWQASLKEYAFYQNTANLNLDFLPMVEHFHADSECIMLLMKKYEAIQRWDKFAYDSIPDLLAEIHSKDYRMLNMTFMPNTNTQSHSKIAEHADCWKRLIESYADNERYAEFDMGLLENMCRDFETIHDISVSLPLSLVHGDFHRNNILWDKDESCFRVCDWQNAAVGYGPSDLSFFISRAKSDGEIIDEEKFMEAYVQSMKKRGLELKVDDILTVIHQESFYVSFSFWYVYLQNADIQRTLGIWNEMKKAYNWLRERI